MPPTQSGVVRTNPQIEKAFTYRPPVGDQPLRYERLREDAKTFAYLIDRYCPESREKSLALTHVENAVMWANAAIARNVPAPVIADSERVIANSQRDLAAQS